MIYGRGTLAAADTDAISVVVTVTLLSIIFAAAAVIGLSLWLGKIGFKARRRGYRGPSFPIFIVTLPLLIILITTASVLGLMDKGKPLEHMPNVLIGPLIILLLAGPILISVPVAALVLYLLPVRKMRQGGRRRVRIPFLVLARTVLVLALVLPVLEVLAAGRLTTAAYYPMSAMLGCAYLCYVGARRQRKTLLDEESQEDPRPPVLYIRPFGQERRYFAAIPEGPQEIAAGPTLDLLYQQQRRYVSFGEYFGPSIRAELGPFIGLGDPADYLTPRGISPAYLGDENWKMYFETLAKDSRAIIAAPGMSTELLWEIEQLKKWGAHQKLFILTEPSDKGWRRRWRNLGNWVLDVQQQTWEQFATMAATKGYQFDVDPGPGSVITFNSAAEQVVLIRNARTPSDYVAAIRERLAWQDRPEGYNRRSPEVPLQH